MHDLAVISKIQSITPIEGKDRIVLAKVENYDTIVQKDDFKVGDVVIYVLYDAILPVKPEYEFLRKRCYSEKWKGFRIRPMKMGGVVSEGLVLPMSSLPAGKKYKLGQVVTDDLEIRLYDPESQLESSSKKSNWFLDIMMKYSWFRKLYNKYFRKSKTKGGYPSWVDKSDEENIEKIWDKIKEHPDTEYIVTEKMEGQAGSFVYDKKGFKVYSHNFNVISGNWVEIAKIYDLEHKLKSYCKLKKIDGICLQGEVCGPGIQSNIYGFDSLHLFLYGGFHLDHTRLNYYELEEIATTMNIPLCPKISDNLKISDFSGLEDIVKFSDGDSIFKNKDKAVPREGLVWRTLDGDIHFKNKSRSYKAWFDKKGE